MTKENDKLEAIKKLIESKFSQIEERISSVEQQIKSQNVALSVKLVKIGQQTRPALELGHVNSAKLKDNLDRIDSNSFEVDHEPHLIMNKTTQDRNGNVKSFGLIHHST